MRRDSVGRRFVVHGQISEAQTGHPICCLWIFGAYANIVFLHVQ
jgi:hypothetical protein